MKLSKDIIVKLIFISRLSIELAKSKFLKKSLLRKLYLSLLKVTKPYSFLIQNPVSVQLFRLIFSTYSPYNKHIDSKLFLPEL